MQVETSTAKVALPMPLKQLRGTVHKYSATYTRKYLCSHRFSCA